MSCPQEARIRAKMTVTGMAARELPPAEVRGHHDVAAAERTRILIMLRITADSAQAPALRAAESKLYRLVVSGPGLLWPQRSVLAQTHRGEFPGRVRDAKLHKLACRW